VAPQVATSSFALDGGICNQLGTVIATDADEIIYPGSTIFQKWKIAGGTGAGIFALDAVSGKLSIANPSAIDFSKTSYTINVTVSDGYFTSLEKEITIPITKKIKVCHKGKNVISIGKMDVPDHLAHGDCIGACESETVAGRSIPIGETSETGSVLVYPNPARGVVNVVLGLNYQRITSIRMYDISGKMVKQISVNGKSNVPITIDKLLPGIYLLKMQGDKVITEKVLIQ